MPFLTLRQVSLSIANHVIFDRVDFQLDKGERVCILGRNGAGKSTFLKLIEGHIEADRGEIIIEKNIKICSMMQDVPPDQETTVFDMVLNGLGDIAKTLSAYEKLIHQTEFSEQDLEKLHRLQTQLEMQGGWRAQQQVEEILSRLSLNGTQSFSALSGGLKRRVLLGAALVSQPDILLLDEPTNHLDIRSIEWLEEDLLSYLGSIIFITHDRQFLKKLATRIIELDRGYLKSYPGRYEIYLQTKEAELSAEAHAQSLFDKKLAQEEVWIRQGIKARRTRNEGRVTALKKMREAKKVIRQHMGTAQFQTSFEKQSGKLVLQAENIGFQYAAAPRLFQDFSLIIERGEKIGIIGQNGVGKSTLIQVLLGLLEPTQGKVKLGTQLQVAYFDQIRNQIDPTISLLDNVAGGRTFIDFNGQSMHVYSYLQQFLFTPEQARSPTSVLSGGEKNRLLLAKLLSLPNNFLILDEPTNDLDLETLDILESLLVSYPGTIILISHDRVFLDNVVTSTLAFDADGVLREYVGGFEDWVRQRPALDPVKIKSVNLNTLDTPLPLVKKNPLSAQEKKLYLALPSDIEALETQIKILSIQMAEESFYMQDPELIKTQQTHFKKMQQQLIELYSLWEELEKKSV